MPPFARACWIAVTMDLRCKRAVKHASRPPRASCVSLLLLTMRPIGRGTGGWSSLAGADLLERVRDELLRPVLQRVAIPGKTKWNDFDQVGVKAFSSIHD